jgi:valyl-tRNA synthetase
MNVPPSKKAQMIIVTETPDIYEQGKHFIARMAFASEVEVTTKAPADISGMVTVVTHGSNVYMPLSELVDFEKELARIAKEKANVEKQLNMIAGKLNNEAFVAKAPEQVVAAEREKEKKLRELLAKLEESAAAMKQ